MKFYKTLLIILLLMIAVSGCSTNKSNSTSITSSIAGSSNTGETQNLKDIPKNVLKDTVPEAEKVPHLFYQYLNNKDYDKVVELLSPDLKFEGDPSNRKYLENIEHTDFIKFKDISLDGGYLNSSQQILCC